MRIAHLTFLVRDDDEAIAWFRQALGFTAVTRIGASCHPGQALPARCGG